MEVSCEVQKSLTLPSVFFASACPLRHELLVVPATMVCCMVPRFHAMMDSYPSRTINHGDLLFNRKVANTSSYTKFAKAILESY